MKKMPVRAAVLRYMKPQQFPSLAWSSSPQASQFGRTSCHFLKISPSPHLGHRRLRPLAINVLMFGFVSIGSHRD